MFEIIVEEGLELLGYRKSRSPFIRMFSVIKRESGHAAHRQAFIKNLPVWKRTGIDRRKLYIARRVFEQSNENTYVVSMSSHTIVYSVMFTVGQLRTFFGDLQRQRTMNLPSPWLPPYFEYQHETRAGRGVHP